MRLSSLNETNLVHTHHIKQSLVVMQGSEPIASWHEDGSKHVPQHFSDISPKVLSSRIIVNLSMKTLVTNSVFN